MRNCVKVEGMKIQPNTHCLTCNRRSKAVLCKRCAARAAVLAARADAGRPIITPSSFRLLYDPQCEDLARHFLSDLAQRELVQELAAEIQRAVEDWIDQERARLGDSLR